MNSDRVLSGAELAQHRKAKRLSQSELGQAIGFGRHAVSYWETKLTIARHQTRCGAPKALIEFLGIKLPDFCTQYARTRGWGLTRNEQLEEKFQAEMARLRENARLKSARRRQRCNARTRVGYPCKLLSEPGKTRCKFHGGKSTGPKTPEGKARIAEAQRKRWAKWRKK